MKKRSRAAASARKKVTWETVRELALALPGVEEGTSYGTPAFRVRGKMLARMREDGETVVVKAGFDEREALMAAAPGTFFVTDHYQNHPMVLVRLAKVRGAVLGEVLEHAWREAAPKRLVAAYDAGS